MKVVHLFTDTTPQTFSGWGGMAVGYRTRQSHPFRPRPPTRKIHSQTTQERVVPWRPHSGAPMNLVTLFRNRNSMPCAAVRGSRRVGNPSGATSQTIWQEVIMNASLHPWARWLEMLRRPTRRRPVRHHPDFADFGTAFGLDLSLSGPATRPGSDGTPPPERKPPSRS